MLKTFSRVLALALFVVLSASAQQAARTDTARFSIGSTQSMVGYANFGSSDLDARFAAAGLPRVARSSATIGIGADIRGGRKLFGAGFQSMLTRNQTTTAHRTRMSGSYSLFDFGYALIQSPRIAVYPLMGVGMSHLSLNVRERGDFGFDDGLHTPSRELGLAATAAVAHAGIIVERRFQRKSGSEFALTVRAGTMRSIGSPFWQSDESKVDNGPGSLRGRYARVSFSRPLSSRRDATLPIVGTLIQSVLR